jgi:hypothetical protein
VIQKSTVLVDWILREDIYDPNLGYGFNLIGKDGGVVRVWAFVDNFLIHRPTWEKNSLAS